VPIIKVVVAVLPIFANVIAAILPIVAAPVADLIARSKPILQSLAALLRRSIGKLAWSFAPSFGPIA
jgi:hypothetical protein